jgi:serine/threonine protein kinase HipA of HipAB toxin-antitoxin module
MPTKHIAQAPDLLIITAKKIADCVESYKASRYAGHYLITYEAINDARSLLVDVEDLMRKLREQSSIV